MGVLAGLVAQVWGRSAGLREAEHGRRLIELTVPEVRWLLLRLVWPRAAAADEVLGWSEWRRGHQYHARRCHYRRRKAEPPG